MLDSMTYAANLSSLDPVVDDVDVVKGSVCDPALVDELVAAHDVVVHFAADSHNDNSLDDPWPFIDTNIIGTYQLIQAVCRHDKRLHHISTDEVYGDLELDDPAKFSESTRSTPPAPTRRPRPAPTCWCGVDPFLRLEATLSNCSNNYGPRQHPEVHPAPGHRHPRGRQAQAPAPAPTSATGSTSTTTTTPSSPSSSRAGWARPTSSAPTAR